MNDQPPRSRMTSEGLQESCGVCGGDRRIANSFGLTTTCPSCHGSGRRVETTGFRDVTKTKASHHRQPNKVEVVAKAQWPATHEGNLLATEIKGSACTSDVKAKLIREVIDYEDSHGQCTQTFIKKIRKQVRPRTTP
jgi:DnaJ-class molecular chaperone